MFEPKRLIIDQLKLNKSSDKNSAFYYDEPHKCNVTIFPANYFYSYSFMHANFLFEKNQSLVISKFMDSFSVHFYGKISVDQKNLFKQFSIYEYFAMNNCPKTYETIVRDYLISKQE